MSSIMVSQNVGREICEDPVHEIDVTYLVEILLTTSSSFWPFSVAGFCETVYPATLSATAPRRQDRLARDDFA